MVDPNFEDSSEEDPQDVQNGDYFLSQVINAVMASPQWAGTLLVWTYDEGGGYYDHVPPPKAVKPDDVGPQPASGKRPSTARDPVQPLRVQGAVRDRVALCQTWLCVECDARLHVDPQADRDEVEPAGAHLS